MHKLCIAVEEKIDHIVSMGISRSNVAILGELVDIVKDIKNMEYWCCKMEYMRNKEHAHTDDYADKKWDKGYDVEKHHSESVAHKTIDEMTDCLHRAYERYSNSASEFDYEKMRTVANELIAEAEHIKQALMDISNDGEIQAHAKRIFK